MKNVFIFTIILVTTFIITSIVTDVNRVCGNDVECQTKMESPQ